MFYFYIINDIRMHRNTACCVSTCYCSLYISCLEDRKLKAFDPRKDAPGSTVFLTDCNVSASEENEYSYPWPSAVEDKESK